MDPIPIDETTELAEADALELDAGDVMLPPAWLERRHVAYLLRLGRALREARDLAAAAIAELRADTSDVVHLVVVQTVAELPATAGPRQWFRVVGNPDLFVGNGPGRPLTRVVTTPINEV